MTEYVQVDRENFLSVVDSMTYRNQDIREAQQFGCSSVPACYKRIKDRFARYYIVYEDTKPIVTVMLKRDGNIVFFIASEVKHHIGLIKCLKELATLTVKNAGAIMTKTAYWYEEAQRMNKLIGFKPYQKYDYYGLYVLEEN
jgi:hypothetical protein